MKIVIDLFQDKEVGGTEVATYRIAKELAGRGYEVYIVTKYSKGLLKRQSKDGFTIIRTPRWRIPILGTIIYNMLTFFKIRHIKLDIIHEQGFGTLGLFFRFFTRTPYVMWGRGLRFAEGFTHLEKFMARLVLGKAFAVIAQTEHMKKQMKVICDKSITIIPNGVDLARFEAHLRDDARRRLGIAEREKIILCVANLRQEKGHEYLIEAMVDVAHNHPEARLFIVGGGPQRDKMQNLAQGKGLGEKIVFTGSVLPDKIPEYMVAADIFVLPSLSEGFPNVLLEAMAAGLPIVATEVGGVSEIVRDGENGFLVGVKSSRQLADKILLLLQDEDARRQFSASNIKKAGKYNWSQIVTALEKVYLKVKSR